MSLPQLTGLDCVACRRGIASVLDGTFCAECGNPVHKKCVKAAVEPPEISTAIAALDGPAAAIRASKPPTPFASDSGAPADRCEKCGGNPDTAIALEVQRERGVQMRVAAPPATGAGLLDLVATKFPVSTICPKCACTQFTPVPPKTMIAFTKDRVCNQCGTRYTPPTPVWAAAIFVTLGSIFFLMGIVSFVFIGAVLSGEVEYKGRLRIFAPIFACIIGGAMVAFGVNSYMKSGAKKEKPNGGDQS